jgi:hypothetical protein
MIAIDSNAALACEISETTMPRLVVIQVARSPKAVVASFNGQ